MKRRLKRLYTEACASRRLQRFLKRFVVFRKARRFAKRLVTEHNGSVRIQRDVRRWFGRRRATLIRKLMGAHLLVQMRLVHRHLIRLRIVQTGAALTIQRRVRLRFHSARFRALVAIVRETCARRIQRVAVSWVSWKQFQRLKALCLASVRILQRVWRGHAGRSLAEVKRREVVRLYAAVKVQSLFRGCTARFLMQAKYEIENTAIVELQRVWRGRIGRALYNQVGTCVAVCVSCVVLLCGLVLIFILFLS
jgi:hypothetical protein